MKPSDPLFRKYLIAFVAPMWLLLLAIGAAHLYFSSQDSRDAYLSLQRESAEAAADHVGQRFSQIVRQIALTATAARGQDAVAQREREVRLLRRLPEITDLLLLDRDGRERLLLARSGETVDDSGTDYSRNTAFQEARSGQPYFSPVYYRGEDEPRITVAMAVGPEQAGVTVAEVDLRVMLDGISAVADAANARVTVADAHGQLIAQANPALKLRKADLVAPQADDETAPAAYAMVAPLGWRVSIEQEASDAVAPMYALAARSAALLLAGLLLSGAVGILLARRLTQPLYRLQESAGRIVQGTPGERIEDFAGQGLETLAARINQLAECLRQSQRREELARTSMVEMCAALPLAVFQLRETADGECGYAFVSENVSDVLGVSAAEIMAEKQARWRTALPDDRIVIEPVMRRAIAARQGADFQHRVRTAGGTRWVRSYTAAPRQVDGCWVWHGCWLDQTQARQREDEMRAAREAAEALARTRSQFLADIGCEIRTPLDRIVALSDLALGAGLTHRQSDCVARIQESAAKLSRIVNDVLDLSRSDAGELILDSAGFTLGQVMHSVEAAIGPAAAAKGVALAVDIPHNLPQALVGDPARLQQILGRLAGNAVRFTEHGEIVLRVERVYSTDRQVMLRFLVRDTGVGMTAEQRNRLFQTPQCEAGPAPRRQAGMGLGLIMCKRLVELMGGGMAVESMPGAGSTFSFTARFGLGQGDSRTQSDGIEGMRVLLVEDNEFNQQVATELLEGAGARVEVAGNGRVALDRLKQDGRFDIVLMDLQMPEMDGYAATAALRADPALAGLPVVALTARATAEERARCLDTGMNGHLLKPIDPEALFGALKRWGLRSLRPQSAPAVGAGG